MENSLHCNDITFYMPHKRPFPSRRRVVSVVLPFYPSYLQIWSASIGRLYLFYICCILVYHYLARAHRHREQSGGKRELRYIINKCSEIT